MSDPANSSGGANQNGASGAADGQENQSVSYETHRKLLGEKKKREEELAATKAKLDALEKERSDAEEKRLAESNQFKDLYEAQKAKTAKLETDLKSREERELNARKLSAFLKTLGGNVDDKYWVHVDIDKIAVDPVTQSVDELSVTKEVERFKVTFPELIKKANGPKLPNDAPAGGVVDKISYSDWQKLPLKDMKKYKLENISD